MKFNNPELRQLLAQDYMMGLMTPRVRRNFEKKLRTDLQLREALRQMESYWNNLSLTIPEETPPKKVWSDISECLFKDSQQTDEISYLRHNLGSLPQEKTAKASIWLRNWALFITISMLSLIFFIGLQQHQGPSAYKTQKNVEHYLSVLSTPDQGSGWLVEINFKKQTLDVQTLQAAPLDNTHTYELWLLTDTKKLIKSFGLMPEAGHYRHNLTLNELNLITKTNRFAVSIEPAGGSPSGHPTSKPVYFGEMIEMN